MIGLVLETHNRMYRVSIGDHAILCQPKGDIRRNSNPDYHLPVVGDQVEIIKGKQKNKGIEGLIVRILGRKNQFARAIPGRASQKRVMAANLDRVFVVSALQKPGLNWGMVDRYLVYCELHQINPIIVLNKIDLDSEWEKHELVPYYRHLGYSLIGVSAKKDEGLQALQLEMGEGISLLTGSSGVGKSSIINAICPKVCLAVREVSDKGGQGKHTTSNSLLIPLSRNSYLADSPGIREFLPPPQASEDIRFGFREFVPIQVQCPFSNCLHLREPDCAIREAVKTGHVNTQRYDSYAALVHELIEQNNGNF